MADMKTLTVGGITYNIKDTGAVHGPETAQVGQTLVVSALDENGKPAVWECADFPSGGSSVLIVTVENDVASHSPAEIYAHVQSGGTAVLEKDGYAYPLVGSYGDYATFEHSYDDDLRDNIVVYDDGSVECREYNSIKSNALSGRIPVPTTAEVGQTIVVTAIDDNGKPTAWECADLPSDAHINSLIDAKLGVIENGTY